MRELSRFEKTFVNIAKTYVRYYPNHSFKFYFDDIEFPVIGNSKKVIKVEFKRSNYVFETIFTDGSLGLGESYCKGLIQVDDKDYKELLFIFVRAAYDRKIFSNLPLLDKIRIIKARLAGSFHTYESQKENINSHYSLSNWFDSDEDSNRFYLYWLDPKYVQYTCAKWDKGTKTLEEAQKNKFEFYAKRLGIDKNSRGKTLLDLGCGWGGPLFYFAEKYGLRCNGITLSTAQASYIRKEIKRRNLTEKVTVENKNVHDMAGEYDHILSIGLLEHIQDYDDLFKKTSLHLKKGGSALFHAIHHEGPFYKPDPFLLKYIFPGGSTPNINNTVRILKRYFKHVSRNDLPYLSYPKTLDVWYDSFCKNEDKIRRLMKEKGKVKDIDFALRVFKHYLLLASTGLTVSGFVSNVLAKNE